jgi:hypothetical protein
MSPRAVHWIGGVDYDGRLWLPGYPCCCTGKRAQNISRGRHRTTVPALVTCKLCLREMRKDPRAKAWGVEP